MTEVEPDSFTFGNTTVAVFQVGRRLDGGAANIGVRPTFDNGARLVEVFVLDYTGDLYDQIVEVQFIKRLREERKYNNIDALIDQMNPSAAALALASVAVAGVGGSFFHPAATALVARLYPEATGKALGLIGIGAGAGFFWRPRRLTFPRFCASAPK